MAEISCVIGLGNPGSKYEATRHNAGFWFADALAKQLAVSFRKEGKFDGEVGRYQSGNTDCWFLKPTTFMNHSGRSVAAFTRFYRIPPEQLLVAYDELDLPAGVARLKFGGGHGGHNGLRDICAALGTRDFARLRIGIGHPGHKEAVVGYVLSRPDKQGQSAIETAIDAAVDHWSLIQVGDLQKAMNALHSQT